MPRVKIFSEKYFRSLENLFLMKYPITNDWGIPELPAFNDDISMCSYIPFNMIGSYTGDKKNTIVHFYIDDYQFGRVWNNPHEYLNRLSEFRAVIAPDFSNYTDMPKALHLISQYKRQWISSYWSAMGLCVVPSLSWGIGCVYDFSFLGVPGNSILATSFVGYGLNMDVAINELDRIVSMKNPTKMIIKAKDADIKFLNDRYNCIFINSYKYAKRK